MDAKMLVSSLRSAAVEVDKGGHRTSDITVEQIRAWNERGEFIPPPVQGTINLYNVLPKYMEEVARELGVEVQSDVVETDGRRTRFSRVACHVSKTTLLIVEAAPEALK